MPHRASYSPTCIIDCRISSTKQQAGGGLEDQKMVCLSYVQAKGWEVFKVYSKVYSGRAEEREDFEEILSYVRAMHAKGTPVGYYVIKSIDRFTRDGAVTFDEMKGRLDLLGVQLVDSYGVIQPEQNTLGHLGFEYAWSKRSPTAAAQLAEAQRAKDEVTDILTRMIGAEIRLTQEGYKVRQATDGFVNREVILSGKRKMIEVPDPERAHYFMQIFSLRAAGTHTDAEIVNEVNSLGFRSKIRKRWDKSHENVIGQTGGTKLTVKQLQRIVQRPIYAGIRCEKWTNYRPVRTQYDGLVSIEMFNRANRGKVAIEYRSESEVRILYDQEPERIVNHRSRYNPDYPYKFLLCSLCRKPFQASASRGKSGQRFPAYHCARGHRYIRIPKDSFDQTVEEFIRTLRFDPAHMEGNEAAIKKAYRDWLAQSSRNENAKQQTVAELKGRQGAKVEAIVATQSAVVRKKLEEEVDALEIRIRQMEDQTPTAGVTEEDITIFLKHARNLMEHPSDLLLNQGNSVAQRAAFALVFRSVPTYEEMRNRTPELAWLFKHPDGSRHAESQLVGSLGVSWNTIEETIRQWRETFCLIRAAEDEREEKAA